MKKRFFSGVLLCLSLSQSVLSQGPLQNKVTISFHQESFTQAFTDLANTQDNLHVVIAGASLDTVAVTMELKDITFDEAMKKLIAQQSFFKDYCVTNYGEFSNIQLFDEPLTIHYFNREKTSGRFYHVNDLLPDSAYHVSNYSSQSVNLRTMKKKLVILDLWNVHCTGCIEAIPQLEALQEQFGDQVQIILVTKDSEQEVQLLKRYAVFVRNTRLPMINGDMQLASLFDYVGVPRQIWLDSSGKVVYNTGREICKEKYIRGFLDGKRMHLYETRDTTLNIDEKIASSYDFIHHDNFGVSAFLAPHVEDKYTYRSFSYSLNDTEKVKLFRELPTDIFMLYRAVFQKPRHFPSTLIIRNFKDPHKYDPDYIVDENVYDYELETKVKGISMQQFRRLMQQQLDIYFGVTSSLEKRRMPCYVLRRTGKTDLLKTQAVKRTHEYVGVNGKNVLATNCEFGNVLVTLGYRRKDQLPLVDETGIDPEKRIDCNMKVDFENDLEGVNRSLAAYGLSVTREERELECIVLNGPQ